MIVLQMSISASILILAIVVIRSLFIHKLPKKTFLVLWGVTLFCLLIPFSINLPSNVGVFYNISTIADRAIALVADATNTQTANPYIGTIPNVPNANDIHTWVTGIVPEGVTQIAPQVSPVVIVWVIGMVGLALFFLVTHFRCRREYKTALPLENDYVNEWLQKQKLWRSIQVRYSDKINAPMTYGIWKPVILFPKTTDWQDNAALLCVLTHELTHIKRFDVLTKWLLAAALCVHWFNPLVWVMYILANRDIEFACDETVVWTFGEKRKSAYALALVGLEEARSGFFPLTNNFAKNAINERIVAIMKLKKRSIVSMAVAFVLVSAVTAGALIVNAQTGDLGNGAPEILNPSPNERRTVEWEWEMQVDVGAFNIDDNENSTELEFFSRSFTDEELAGAMERRQWFIENYAPANVNLIYLNDNYQNTIVIPQGTSEAERRAVMAQNPDAVFRVHIDDFTNVVEMPLNLLAVRRSDEHLHTAEQWAYILERIESGLTFWMDED